MPVSGLINLLSLCRLSHRNRGGDPSSLLYSADEVSFPPLRCILKLEREAVQRSRGRDRRYLTPAIGSLLALAVKWSEQREEKAGVVRVNNELEKMRGRPHCCGQFGR